MSPNVTYISGARRAERQDSGGQTVNEHPSIHATERLSSQFNGLARYFSQVPENRLAPLTKKVSAHAPPTRKEVKVPSGKKQQATTSEFIDHSISRLTASAKALAADVKAKASRNE